MWGWLAILWVRHSLWRRWFNVSGCIAMIYFKSLLKKKKKQKTCHLLLDMSLPYVQSLTRQVTFPNIRCSFQPVAVPEISSNYRWCIFFAQFSYYMKACWVYSSEDNPAERDSSGLRLSLPGLHISEGCTLTHLPRIERLAVMGSVSFFFFFSF